MMAWVGSTSRASIMTESAMDSSGTACSEAWSRPSRRVRKRLAEEEDQEEGQHLLREDSCSGRGGGGFEDPARGIRQAQPETLLGLGENEEGREKVDLQARDGLVSSVVPGREAE
jgi:hypothetical protein